MNVARLTPPEEAAPPAGKRSAQPPDELVVCRRLGRDQLVPPPAQRAGGGASAAVAVRALAEASERTTDHQSRGALSVWFARVVCGSAANANADPWSYH